MLCLRLLEAIHQDDILANIAWGMARGVSGRANWVRDMKTGQKVLGRFNLKAGQPDVEHRASAAFSGDMGLSTPLFPSHYGDCTDTQKTCFLIPNGAQESLGEHEVPARLIDFVTMYSQNLALPQRRDVDDARVLAGKKAFYESNCIACHVPKYVTRRDASRPEHRFQKNVVMAWSGIEFFRFEPLLAEHRFERAYFWPDPRRRTSRKIKSLLADPAWPGTPPPAHQACPSGHR